MTRERPATPVRGAARARARILTALTLVLLCAPPSAVGHGGHESELRGAVPCIDAASVRATTEHPSAETREALERLLERDGREALTRILDAARVPAHHRETCDGSGAHLHLDIHARFLDPERYVGFGEDATSFRVALRVAAHDGGTADATGGTPDLRFMSSITDLYSREPGGTSLDALIVTAVRETSRSLVTHWWEDNPAPRAPATLPPLLGLGAASLVGCLAYFAFRRR